MKIEHIPSSYDAEGNKFDSLLTKSIMMCINHVTENDRWRWDYSRWIRKYPEDGYLLLIQRTIKALIAFMFVDINCLDSESEIRLSERIREVIDSEFRKYC